jgi:5'-phosphate synthase pdxT subunit
MKIGVLALQGAFYEHIAMLKSLGVETFEIRQKKDLENQMDGLILPGGESTVIGKLLKELDIFDILKDKIENGLPVFGTCAGLILLSKETETGEKWLATMNIKTKRNAYGRQLGSFSKNISVGNISDFNAVFIRAPYITEVGENVEILAEVEGKIVAARQKNQLVTAFHPELTQDLRFHQMFLDIVKNNI